LIDKDWWVIIIFAGIMSNFISLRLILQEAKPDFAKFLAEL
jgi:hypothetical protein